MTRGCRRAVGRAGVALGVALLLVGLAHGAVVEVRSPSGEPIFAARGGGAIRLPDGRGALLRVASSHTEGDRVELVGVEALGGRVLARRVVVDGDDPAATGVEGLAVDGHGVAARPNTLVPLGPAGYVVVIQQATLEGKVGTVGLRIRLLRPVGRVPAGSELLIGLAPRAETTGAATDPEAILALGRGPLRRAPAGSGYVYPVARRGPIVGCPFALGSTHSPFAWPANLESDNAIDIAVPVGTPVLAVSDGVIGDLIGPLSSGDPHLAGERLHLETGEVRFYYAHLSRIDVVPRQRVVAGQQLGLSGSAVGVPHLHFAQDVGNPADTAGEREACPTWRFHPEPW